MVAASTEADVLSTGSSEGLIQGCLNGASCHASRFTHDSPRGQIERVEDGAQSRRAVRCGRCKLVRQAMSPSPVTIVNVGYRSTNYWVISAGRSRLLVDLGWPGTMATMRASLNRAGIPLSEIEYGLATHYHIDHAGLAQDLKNAAVRLLMIDVQVPFVHRMKQHIKAQDQFTDISMDGNVVISVRESRPLLHSIGIAGEIFHTPGHSEDSVSLLLDDGAVFTGDLTDPRMVGPEDPDVVRSSWQLLKDRGAVQIYAGHGPPRPLPPLDP
jgi:ribonuclease/clavin/mitogillin